LFEGEARGEVEVFAFIIDSSPMGEFLLCQLVALYLLEHPGTINALRHGS
jgi:hypothetical protein